MARVRQIGTSLLSVLISTVFSLTPVNGAIPAAIGTVIFADHARLGTSSVTVGASVFGGDRLVTDQSGSAQIRAGAARVYLPSSSAATFSRDADNPSAVLSAGTATFSTSSAKAFALHVASAVIRANTDAPTIGQVTVLGPKELVVRSTRGSLTISVEDDTRVISEGSAYRVVLDPSSKMLNAAAAAQGPRGSGTRGPAKAGKSKFAWFAVAITAVITYFALSEVYESPARPR